MTVLADRVRSVLNPNRAQPHASPLSLDQPGGSSLESVLGGEWRRFGDAVCFVVERRFSASARHGDSRIGEMAGHLTAASEAAFLLAGASVRVPFVFFDLETTGLSGGAGTHAFLAGCGWFDADESFVVRQYFLAAFADEPTMLRAVADELDRAGALVSFNGKSFDAPLLESRYQYHRREWAGARLPHLDMLHVARRFWREPDSSLTMLEQQLLGASRHGDVPGFEIPSRYFHFLRTRDAQPLARVLEHNRFDLLSLAGLTARAVSLMRADPGDVHDAREAFAVGRTCARGGLHERAGDFFERAVELCVRQDAWRPLQVEALRARAIGLRRARRYGEAAERWRQILDIPQCHPSARSEASEALAIHHEHRVRNLIAARTFALRGLTGDSRGARHRATQHRLARIERKLERVEPVYPNPMFGEG